MHHLSSVTWFGTTPVEKGPGTQRWWCLCFGGSLCQSRWEFDLPWGKKKEAFHRERSPVLIALIAKHKLQTEELRRSGSLINTQISTLNMLNMYGRFLPCSIDCLFISSLNDAFDAVPWHRSRISRKRLDLEERYMRHSKESADLNTHITATFFTAAVPHRIDFWFLKKKKWHHSLFIHGRGTGMRFSRQGLSAIIWTSRIKNKLHTDETETVFTITSPLLMSSLKRKQHKVPHRRQTWQMEQKNSARGSCNYKTKPRDIKFKERKVAQFKSHNLSPDRLTCRRVFMEQASGPTEALYSHCFTTKPTTMDSPCVLSA